jgi:RNA polymerase sigma-70 factor (ECF subfamily)
MDSDLQLEDRIRKGDAPALAQYIEASRGKLLAFIERQLGPALRRKVEPDDIYQEVSVACVRSLPEVDLAERELFAWLCQVAERRIIDAHRKFYGTQKRSAGREVPLEVLGTATNPIGLIDLLVASLTTPSEAFSRDQRETQLLTAMRTLPSEAQEALRLRYVEGLPSKEIAERLQKTDGAVRVLLTRSLKKLGDLLRDVIGSR